MRKACHRIALEERERERERQTARPDRFDLPEEVEAASEARSGGDGLASTRFPTRFLEG